MSLPPSFPETRATPYGAAHDGLDVPASLPPPEPTPTPATDLLNRVVQGAHASLDRLAESATPQVQQLEAGLAAAGDTLQARADQVRHTGDEWAESLRSTVREHPLATVAAALAAGVLIARLTR